MGRFRYSFQSLDSEGEEPLALSFEAEGWMMALGQALLQFGVDDRVLARADCHFREDGCVEVRDGVTGAVMVLNQELELLSESSSGPKMSPDRLLAPLHVVDEAPVEMSEAVEKVRDADTPGRAAEAALDVLMARISAESGSVLLHEADRERLWFAAIRGPMCDVLVGEYMPEDRGIAGVVLRSGTALRIRDAWNNPNHYQEIDSRSGYQTRAMIVVPVRSESVFFGVLELMNPTQSEEFSDGDLRTATWVAGKLADRLVRT
ncbi:MAG: GAF domain-containing protein [Myxococcota bacterium]|jgi:hypothetical protein|nr:GAF domain-containing protein [Myxococcota bacterium]